MEIKRKPFQGVLNIIRFNWHFYVIAGLILMVLTLSREYFPDGIQSFVLWISILATLTIVVSLLVSFYIYDCSSLYKLNWLPDMDNKTVLNINAGFDETSGIIKTSFPHTKLTICDFYNPEKHTEVSIKRARRAYPPLENTIKVTTFKLPFQDNTFDHSLAIFAIHEIRDENERVQFLKELNRVTKSSGQIFITEHLRDFNNFIAYTIGFFHFYSKQNWLSTFARSKLTVIKEMKITPFVSLFILKKDGDTL